MFNPLLRALTLRFPAPGAAGTLAAVAFFLSFTLLGVWHGTTALFVVYGLLLGLGATITKLWQDQLTKRLGKSGYKALCQRAWYFQLSRGLTLAYFAMALGCWWLDGALIARMGIGWLAVIMLISLVVMSAGIACIGAVADALSRHAVRAVALLPAATSDRARMVTMALMLWLALNLVGAFGSTTPEFIYKAF